MIERHAGEIEDGGEDSLHGGDDEAAVHDKLGQRCRPLVRVAAVDEAEAGDMLELLDTEVCRQRCLLTFLRVNM